MFDVVQSVVSCIVWFQGHAVVTHAFLAVTAQLRVALACDRPGLFFPVGVHSVFRNMLPRARARGRERRGHRLRSALGRPCRKGGVQKLAVSGKQGKRTEYQAGPMSTLPILVPPFCHRAARSRGAVSLDRRQATTASSA